MRWRKQERTSRSAGPLVDCFANFVERLACAGKPPGNFGLFLTRGAPCGLHSLEADEKRAVHSVLPATRTSACDAVKDRGIRSSGLVILEDFRVARRSKSVRSEHPIRGDPLARLRMFQLPRCGPTPRNTRLAHDRNGEDSASPADECRAIYRAKRHDVIPGSGFVLHSF